MKVLFAVSNEEISESIVKKYQKEYKQIISYKNVYYFNAILKELQKDKTYDRVVISEDLEAFTNTQYDQIDKFIFEKLDSISDEASNVKGNDIPIILIGSDRRTKSEPMLVKLFGIGVYNAIIGNDRSVDEVCRLINRPRVKKEAKSYYKIDTEEVNYQAENENDVSEMEIQNIVAHYKRLGKNEDRYVESFNNIAAQYNDTQLRIITKFLPLNVRAVLEEKSPKYQKIMSFNNTVSDDLRKAKNDKEDGPSQILLKSQNKDRVLSKPVVIPSAVNMNETKKLAKQKPVQSAKMSTQPSIQPTSKKVQQPVSQYKNPEPIIEGFEEIDEILQEAPRQVVQQSPRQEAVRPTIQQQSVQPIIQQQPGQPTMQQQSVQPTVQQQPVQPTMQEVAQPVIQPVKRGRGRPRKNPVTTPPTTDTINQMQTAKRGRGRPRKNTIPVPEVQEQPEEMVLPGLESQEQEPEETFLPGFYDVDTQEEVAQTTPQTQIEQENFLPGFDDNAEEDGNDDDDDMILPGLGMEEPEEEEQEQPTISQPMQSNSDMSNNYESNLSYDTNNYNNNVYNAEENYDSNLYNPSNFDTNSYNLSENYTTNSYNSGDNYTTNSYNSNITNVSRTKQETYEEIDLSNLLTPDKKIVTFVGTSKNGTSFIVNNIAELLSSMGINTAILDTTKNRNSYYIYTKNEEPLREIATQSIEGLARGIAKGISVNKALTVYTSLPDEEDTINHVDKILETLLQKHSLILIDTDFQTPVGYFKQSQETYLVQSMDILTIQPLTAFLKELKVKNILDEKKLRVVLNKVVKIRGIKDETIIGGMAFYNDPAMSFMTELFDRDRIKYVSIPFEDETYIRYLEGIIECEISLKGYSKVFVQTLKELGNMIYPIVTTTSRNNRNYQPPSAQTNGGGNFSSNMNNTLDKMRGY